MNQVPKSILFSLCIVAGLAKWMTASPDMLNKESVPVIVQINGSADILTVVQSMNSYMQDYEQLHYVRQVSKILNLHLFRYQNNLTDPDNFLLKIQQVEGVLKAYFPSRMERRYKEPDDPFYGNQWHLNTISAPETWETTTGGTNFYGHDIVVAVMDFGYQTDHPDLIDNFWVNDGEIPDDGLDNDNNGYTDDYLGLNVRTGNDKHPSDFHGTGSSGIIGAKGDNKLGISGVNWDVKMLLFSPMEYTYHVVEALEYCILLRRRYNETSGSEGAFVVATSLSLGVPAAFPSSSSEMADWCALYEEAGKVGILTAAAAPNAELDISEDGDMPSLCPTTAIISVTNSDINDEKVLDAGYSREHVDLSAPGDGSYSTYLQSGYREFGGCSAATPHVGGAIGLLYSLPLEKLTAIAISEPDKAMSFVRKSILESVTLLPSLKGITSSGGRLNLFEATERLRQILIEDEIGDRELDILSISPNPADDIVEVVYQVNTLDPLHIDIYDMLGRKVMTETRFPEIGPEGNFSLRVDHLSPAVYFMILRSKIAVSRKSFLVH